MDALTRYWQQTGLAGEMPEACAFGAGMAQQDELCALVLAGIKRGTASLARWYVTDPKPQAGELRIILDGSAQPRGVIEILHVNEMPFHAVDATFAAIEGEGDFSLAYWQAEHQRFFSNEMQAEGLSFTDQEIVVLEQFRLIFPAST